MKQGKSGIFFYSTRIAGAILLIILYHWGLQPARTAFTGHVALPMVSSYANQTSSAFNVQRANTGFNATFKPGKGPKETSYKPQLGFFFLAAVVALLFVTTRLRWYLYLILLHIAALFVILGVLFLSRHGWYPGFILIDFLISYFIPGLTIAFVPLVYHITHEEGLAFIGENAESPKA